ncbi:TPA: hypothetical protein DEP34_02185 [Candidatus Uhrbacteria bacterium]|uniref:Transposase IS200-like domain-containing protein n=1 Tax=Candidatus Uhrbacteria bacterium GW2011_GWF2_46_218 TaxID=1619001 RepID=A0A0G1PIY2_9BACT|nr:MAG: hypothetical protein UX45_C0014G0028 [Candidatus Uhrbacteria bacterium GW2011_GWF2_46_218]HBK33958.1 hypothetical protein [Candidatus Uhrbacteria bacterium]HCB19171.1 hypothetical protein [Candidatus Uhrbacteria bacterium]
MKEWNYTNPGAYFVTICTQKREMVFGEVKDGEMIMNVIGKMVHHIWNELPNKFPDIVLDEYIVMPDHFHGIIWITAVGAGLVPAHGLVPAQCTVSVRNAKSDHCSNDNGNMTMDTGVDTRAENVGDGLVPSLCTVPSQNVGVDTRAENVGVDTRSTPTLGDIIRVFKSMTTVEYIVGVKKQNWPSFSCRLWQRGYYDHIVRDENDLSRIRDYIRNNPSVSDI